MIIELSCDKRDKLATFEGNNNNIGLFGHIRQVVNNSMSIAKQ